MRSATKTFVGLAGIGVLVATAKLGLPTTAASAETLATASGTTSTAADTTNGKVAAATPAASTSKKAASAKSTKTSSTKTVAVKKKTSTSKASQSSSSSSSSTSTSSSSSSSGASGTKSGSSYESVFGSNIQVSVTKTNGTITDVTCVVCEATGGRRAAFSTLIQKTVANNGVNFGNLGGATYTTKAFKKAVQVALAKF